MENRCKSFALSYTIEDLACQKNRYRENYYHPYDDISKTRLKQRTNNTR